MSILYLTWKKFSNISKQLRKNEHVNFHFLMKGLEQPPQFLLSSLFSHFLRSTCFVSLFISTHLLLNQHGDTLFVSSPHIPVVDLFIQPTVVDKCRLMSLLIQFSISFNSQKSSIHDMSTMRSARHCAVFCLFIQFIYLFISKNI